MDYKIVLMRNAENDPDSFISYLLFEKKSEQSDGNVFNEKISLMFKLVVLNIEKNACVKGETIHNHVGDVTPD